MDNNKQTEAKQLLTEALNIKHSGDYKPIDLDNNAAGVKDKNSDTGGLSQSSGATPTKSSPGNP